MKFLNYLIIFIFGISIANANNIFSDSTNQFPSCNAKNDYWIQQLGNNLVSTPKTHESSVTIVADHLNGKESGVHYVSGNVIAYSSDKSIFANWLSYNQNTSQIVAGDHVILNRQYDTVTGKSINYYLNLDKGSLEMVTLYQNKINMYISGDKINIYDKKHYDVTNSFLTTCNLNDPAWFIRTKKTNFDYQDSQGNAIGATFYAESIPIIYMPYFQFPLGERRSGFLMPEYGYSSATGLILGVPYYLNLAPNYDLTLEPKIFSQKGTMLNGEFRFLTNNDQGKFYTEQVNNNWDDNNYNPQYRWYWHLDETHKLFDFATIGFDYNQVSDNNYFVDFGNFYSTTNNVNLNQMIYANYAPNWGSIGIKAQQYQTLQPTGQTTTAAIYAVKPQINFTLNPTKTFFGTKSDLFAQYTYFTTGPLSTGQTELQNAKRTIIYPSINLPIDTSWGFIKPKFGYNMTSYQLDPYNGSVAGTINRGLTITSLDSGLYFDKELTFNNNFYTQTLEPRLYYLYVPNSYQGNIPIFDTSPATYNLSQLFSENRFAGYDRINAANDITLGLRQRLINDNNGIEVANLGIGYKYYLDNTNTFLYGNYNQYQQLYSPPPPSIVGELTNKWANNITTNGNIQYNQDYNTITGYSAGLKYNPDDYKIINLTYTYQYQLPLFITGWSPGQIYQPTEYINQHATDISGQWPIYANRWFIEGRANYDFTRDIWLNKLGGIEYNGGCWLLHLMYQEYVTNINQQNSMFFMQVELKGLSSIGNSDPNDNLKLNIPGYMPVTNMVKYGQYY